jgi:type I restriction enzyme M protein
VLAELPENKELMKARASLLGSFEKAVRPVGLLDAFQVSGVIATWWGSAMDGVQNDLRTVSARGFLGLVEGWEASILTALEEAKEGKTKSKENPLEHRLVKRLMPEFLAEIGELEAKKAELEAELKAGSGGGEEEDEAEGEEGGEEEEGLSEEEIAAKRKELGAAKKALKAKLVSFARRLREAREALDEDGARELVLGILRGELEGILARYVGEQRRLVVGAFEGWWDKYRVTLVSLEEERDEAAERLRGFLKGLGYA